MRIEDCPLIGALLSVHSHACIGLLHIGRPSASCGSQGQGTHRRYLALLWSGIGQGRDDRPHALSQGCMPLGGDMAEICEARAAFEINLCAGASYLSITIHMRGVRRACVVFALACALHAPCMRLHALCMHFACACMRLHAPCGSGMHR